MKNTVTLKIQTPDPFSFKECLVYLNRSPLELLHTVGQERVLKLLRIGEDKVLIRLGEKGNGLAAEFLNCRPSEETKQFVKKYIADWFDFDIDLKTFYKITAGVKPFDLFEKKYNGLRRVGIHDLFQAFCWAIIGQQVNMKFAYTLFGRFIEKFGESLVFENQTYWLFPQPAIVAKANSDDFRQMQFTRMKAEYIIHIAGLLASGELSREVLLKTGDFAAAQKALVSIRGVGPWTANYVLMRCLGAPDAFPIEDVGLHNALKIQLGLEEKPDREMVERIAKSVPGWGSYLAFYLYRSLL